MISLLFIEDDDAIRVALKLALEDEGYEVREAPDGRAGLAAFAEREPDLVLLDLRLPDLSGFEVCRSMRSSSIVPIIIVTAQTDTYDLVAGLEAGADDYVTKPFSLDEIIARIKAILRRTIQEDEEAVLETGPIVLDQDTHEVRVAGTPIELSPTEFKLLRYLMQNANRVLSKSQILDHVWEYDFNGDAGIVESYISYLRRKLDPLTEESLIQTKRGFGYMLKTDAK